MHASISFAGQPFVKWMEGHRSPRMRRPLLLRDLHSGHHLELFLVSAVSAVLAIRGYLRLTNYPQVGGESLHIAHMLWGGLLMLAALLILLAFIGESSRRLAAFVGGVGFGTFIDEVGKFITRDNDYFFRPAVALIYVTFVLTYIALRFVRRRPRPARRRSAHAPRTVRAAARVGARTDDAVTPHSGRPLSRPRTTPGLRQGADRVLCRTTRAQAGARRHRRQ